MTTAAKLGYRMGAEDARRYATGTKADRRIVRARLAKAHRSDAAFWGEYAWAFTQAADDFAAAITEGRIARTVNPVKLTRLVARAVDAA
jgi:hypothetical protein